MPWAQLAIAAYGVYAGNKAKKDAKKQMARNDPYRELIYDGIKYSQPYGKSLIHSGTAGLNNAYNYYNSMLNNPGSALAPQITALGDQYQQAAQNNREFGQRGGVTSAASTQQPFEQAKAQSDLLFQGKQAGAQGVAGLSGQMLGAGQGLLREGQMSALGTMGQNTVDTQVGFGMGQQIGGGLGSMLGAVDWKNMDWGKMFGKGGGGQDTIGDYNWGNIFGNQAGDIGQIQGYNWGDIFGNQAQAIGGAQSQPSWSYWGKYGAGWGG